MYYSGVADETIKNRTVCVKEGDRIRNIKHAEDINAELLVYVDNVVEYRKPTIYEINRLELVRYSVLNVSFR